MLMHLREIPGIDIPTTRQLNNFLSAVRDKLAASETMGTSMCLADFDNIFLNHKSLPEDSDTLFVVDVSTEVKIEEGKLQLLFRIFFSTKRLLSFACYVSG